MYVTVNNTDSHELKYMYLNHLLHLITVQCHRVLLLQLQLEQYLHTIEIRP